MAMGSVNVQTASAHMVLGSHGVVAYLPSTSRMCDAMAWTVTEYIRRNWELADLASQGGVDDSN